MELVFATLLLFMFCISVAFYLTGLSGLALYIMVALIAYIKIVECMMINNTMKDMDKKIKEGHDR